jgi:hypothetical protein
MLDDPFSQPGRNQNKPPAELATEATLMAGESEERLFGVLTSARLLLTTYDLFFTQSRIIAAKASSSLPAVLFFGVAGLALTPKNPEARLGTYAGLSFEQILSANRKNFEIPMGQVERAVLDGGRANVTLPRLTVWASGRKMMFAFVQSMWRRDLAQLSYAKELLSPLMGDRITFERL